MKGGKEQSSSSTNRTKVDMKYVILSALLIQFTGTIIYHPTGELFILSFFSFCVCEANIYVYNTKTEKIENMKEVNGTFFLGVQNGIYSVCSSVPGGTRHINGSGSQCHFPFRSVSSGKVYTACTNESSPVDWCYPVQEPKRNFVWDADMDWGQCDMCVPQSGSSVNRIFFLQKHTHRHNLFKQQGHLFWFLVTKNEISEQKFLNVTNDLLHHDSRDSDQKT